MLFQKLFLNFYFIFLFVTLLSPKLFNYCWRGILFLNLPYWSHIEEIHAIRSEEFLKIFSPYSVHLRIIFYSLNILYSTSKPKSFILYCYFCIIIRVIIINTAPWRHFVVLTCYWGTTLINYFLQILILCGIMMFLLAVCFLRSVILGAPNTFLAFKWKLL